MLEFDLNPPDRDGFGAHLEAYLAKTLHVDVDLSPSEGNRDLPVFMTALYDFYLGNVADTRCQFIALRDGHEPVTPSEITKHVKIASESARGPVVFATSRLNATLRTRLIAAGVAFVVPGNQLYIPQLAMDLREHFRAPKTARSEKLSPSAQAVLFYSLLNRDNDEHITPSRLADPMRYSPMTIGRAFDELAAVSLARIIRIGREKHLTFVAERRLLIDAAKTLLSSPVSKTYPVRWKDFPGQMKLSGLSALGELTDLNADEIQTVAVSLDAWREMKNEGVIELVEEPYEADTMVETWRYDPDALSDGPIVDPLSLYARYWDHAEERVAMAAEQLLRQWS